jgi:hypothetical protein
MATMFRAGMCALLLLMAPVVAQAAETFVVLLRDPAGNPVAGATAAVTVHPAGEIAALTDCFGGDSSFASALPTAQRRTATSDGRGELRIPRGDGGTASGHVVTADGLGALFDGLQAGRAQRVVMAPMAAVTTATATEPLRVHARATTADGRAVTFTPPPGAVVRLPAGDYELWVHGSDGWLWRRKVLTSGERFAVAFTGPARRVQTPFPEAFHPAGRPDVVLFPAGASETLLRGDALQAPMVARCGAEFVGPHRLPTVRPDAVLVWPPIDRPLPTVAVPTTAASEPRVAMFSLLQRTNGEFAVLGASLGSQPLNGRAPAFSLPPRPDGDAWLLLVAAGHAPQARPWLDAAGEAFRLERGAPLVVLARDERGEPIADLAFDYTPTDMAPAKVVGRSDGYGKCRLGPVLAPGTLRVSDPRFANQRVDLESIPGAGVTVVVTSGLTMSGVARWSDGAPARGVLVTLRDAAGVLRPAQRAIVTGDDGGFTFGGLPEQRALLLFASAQRDGRTWSGKLDRLLAGGEAIELVLRNEDPEFGAGR